MPKDNRIFITLAVDMDRHPKFATLNDAQKFLIVRALMHCREYLTDGQIGMAVWRKMGTDRNRKAVLATGVCSEVPEQNCVIFHDYAEHNQTRAEVEAAKEKARSAGQKGGLRKAANAKRNAHQTPSEALAPARHPLSENVAEIEIEKERTTYVPAAAYESNASEPENDGDANTDLDSWKLVQHTCRDLRGPTKTALRHEVDQLLRAGATHADITTGLQDWMTRPKARPGLLGHLVDDATKVRIAPTTTSAGTHLSHHDRKTAGWDTALEDAKRSLGLVPTATNQAALPTSSDRPLISLVDTDYIEDIA
ncbi:hypothetical protein [Nocardia rhizosphaerae]|uniref:Uncharacterized protein n=1 Tax=Nocardia rhizosphaerae TaxID=1691571 RepID=A0ABV8LE67_9NOCA